MKITQGAGHRKRLRDRYARSALTGFHDYEAVELLLTFAVPRRDVKPAAKELIKRFGSLKALFDAEKKEILKVNGVGEKGAFLIASIKQCVKSYLEDLPLDKTVITGAADANAFAQKASVRPEDGTIRVLYLNSRNEVLAWQDFSSEAIGSATLPDGKKIIHAALFNNARSMVLWKHDDRAGKKTKETAALKKFIKDLASAAELVEVLVHDLILASDNGYSSVRDLGWLG